MGRSVVLRYWGLLAPNALLIVLTNIDADALETQRMRTARFTRRAAALDRAGRRMLGESVLLVLIA